MADPVIDEIRRVRDDTARQFGYNAQALGRHFMRTQKKSGHPVVDQPAAKTAPTKSRRRPNPKAAA